MARKISFDAPPPEPPAAEPAPLRARPLVGLERTLKQSGALRAISGSFSDLSEQARRAADIERTLTEGQTVVEIDPALVDASFVQDRMEATAEENAAFLDIIRRHGQLVPILVRPKQDAAGRFEVAFGHRRLRAARDLGVSVRAVVRDLSDDELVVAQGQENSGRTDLTFIERARFAARLEARGFSRETIMAALAVDKTNLSRLIAIATRIPGEIVEAIGPAPGIGRPRWQDLSDLLREAPQRARAARIVAEPDFARRTSDACFETLLARLRKAPARRRREFFEAADGTRAARLSADGDRLTVTFDDRATPQLGAFVRSRLQALYDAWKAGEPP